MNRIAIATLALILLLIGVGTLWLAEKPVTQPAPLEPLTLGVERSLLPAAVWVAADQGYFQQEGLALTIREFDSGKASFEAMLNDEGIDISTVAPTPIMFKSFKRKDFAIIATFVHSYQDLKVIAHRGSGIATAADLRGKKIGTPFGTTGQFFTESFLVFNDIAPSEVELVDIPPSALGGALEQREVDAIVIWEPHAYNSRQLLAQDAIVLPSSTIYWEAFNFMVMDGTTKQKPRALQKFLRAIARATQFIRENKQQAQSIVAQRLKLDGEVVRALWDEFTFELSLEQELIMTLEQEARWAVRNQLVDATVIPNYMDSLYWSPLEAVEPETVRVFR